ncbi:histidine kinase [Paucibacter sp. APW11]|uniref:Histidine kinase n=2 Tax=Roseateles aquae TaxID=3077235 RepID=A0ABU3P9P5_9BURK|nr:histidine kinase [Paucibacter sp. APW11]
MSLIQLAISDTPWQGILLYTSCITICCSGFVQLLSQFFTSLRNRGRAPDQQQSWPGPGLMAVSLLLGTALGIEVGGLIGNQFSGFHSARLLALDRQTALATLIFSLLPGIALTNYFVVRQRIERARTEAQTAQRVAAETRLRLLEAQLEPHMLFNTLANLRVLIGMDPGRAQEMLDHLNAFLRATLTASRVDGHSLATEFARLDDYLALMKVRMGERLQTRFELPEALAALEVPPLLLQPLVENAIKHGLEPQLDGGQLIVSACEVMGAEGQVLLLSVRDSGCGLSESPSSSGTRFGLQQVRDRLQTRFGSAANLAISGPPEGGCLVELRLPLAQLSHPGALAPQQP